MVDSDDEDFLIPTSKRSRTEEKLYILLENVDNIKDTLGDVMSLTKDTQIPLGSKRVLHLQSNTNPPPCDHDHVLQKNIRMRTMCE